MNTILSKVTSIKYGGVSHDITNKHTITITVDDCYFVTLSSCLAVEIWKRLNKYVTPSNKIFITLENNTLSVSYIDAKYTSHIPIRSRGIDTLNGEVLLYAKDTYLKLGNALFEAYMMYGEDILK